MKESNRPGGNFGEKQKPDANKQQIVSTKGQKPFGPENNQL